MKNLDEKIYEILENKKESLSTSEIANFISDASKQEITKKLSDMNRQGIVYRKIREGKAYYSINSVDGEGMNPIQKNIKDFQIKMNSATSNISDLSLESSKKVAKEKFNSINLEYTKKQVYENEKYSLEIPDDFKIIKEEGRDFVAYLQNQKQKDLDWNMGGSILNILPSSEIPNTKKLAMTLPALDFIIYDLSFWSEGYNNFRSTIGVPNYYKIWLSNGMSRIISLKLDPNYEFYVLCSIKGALKQIRFQFTNAQGTEKDLLDIVRNIMNKFVCKEKNEFDDFQNPKFLSKNLSKRDIAEYSNLVKNLIINLNAMYSLSVKACDKEFQTKQLIGKENIIEHKTSLREYLKLIIATFETYLDQIVKFVETARKNNIDENNLKEVYGYLKLLIDNNEVKSVEIGDDEISEKSQKAPKINHTIFTDEVIEIIKDFIPEDGSSKNKEKPHEVTSENKTEKIDEVADASEELIKQAQKQIYRLKRDWDNFSNDYQSEMSSRTITSEYQLKSLINTFKRNITAFGDKYDDFITTLDKNGRKLLSKGANSYFVNNVCKIIGDALSAIENLSTDFSTHGSAYLNLGTFDYEISSELNDIKYWWESKYYEMPDVVERRRKESQLREKEKKEQQSKVNSLVDNLTDDMCKAEKEWEAEKQDIENQREKNIKDYSTTKEKELKNSIDKLTKEKNEIENDLNAKILDLKKNIKKATEELESLGFLKFVRKDQLRQEIDINNQNIEKYKEKLKELNTDLTSEISEQNKKVENDIDKYKNDIAKKYIFPSKPSEIAEDLKSFMTTKASEPLTRTQIELSEEAEKIYTNLCLIAKPVTITELQCVDSEMMEMSNQRIATLLKRLVDARRIGKIVENKKAYFYVLDEETIKTINKSKMHLIDDSEIGTKFAKDRKVFANELEKYSDYVEINEIVKKSEVLKSMPNLRVYQVLKSFIDEGRIMRKLENNNIYIAKC